MKVVLLEVMRVISHINAMSSHRGRWDVKSIHEYMQQVEIVSQDCQLVLNSNLP